MWVRVFGANALAVVIIIALASAMWVDHGAVQCSHVQGCASWLFLLLAGMLILFCPWFCFMTNVSMSKLCLQ